MSDVLVLLVSIFVVAPLALSLLVAGVLSVRDTIRQRGDWGIPFGIPNCRHCRARMPAFRVPANFRQGMWGGWTCRECGLEVDKWGEPIPGQTRLAKWALPEVDPVPRTRSNLPEGRRVEKPGEDVRRSGDTTN